MPNELDARKIIQRLNEEQNMELMRYELELTLERELAKPASEMNIQLVDELLGALEEETSDSDKQVIWESIEKQMCRNTGKRRMTMLQRIAAGVLILISISFISVGSAYAFNWSFLLKFLQPLAETFGIYSDNNSITHQTGQYQILYSDDQAAFEQLIYVSAEDMPMKWEGFRVQPTWKPERFSFLQGSEYVDDGVAVFSVSYTADKGFFNLTTTFFNDDEDVSHYEYQKTLTDPILAIIAGQEVTYYTNSDDLRISASWINQNAHYSVFGDITEEELRNIVQSLVK